MITTRGFIRDPNAQELTKVTSFRVSPGELEIIKRAAKATGVTKSKFIADCALKKARRILKESEIS